VEVGDSFISKFFRRLHYKFRFGDSKGYSKIMLSFACIDINAKIFNKGIFRRK
jgi:hypothetical protein